MPVRTLIVDDSAFFRRRLTEILNADKGIEVVGVAVNGAEALEKVAQLKPDVITMDIEMPVMDGITALKKIMATHPTPVLMFSAFTQAGAKATLDALEAGAIDYLPKQFNEISSDDEVAKRTLQERVRTIGSQGLASKRLRAESIAVVPRAGSSPAPQRKFGQSSKGKIELIAIGTSTGGPAALPEVLKQLPVNFSVPILVIQHMPSTFTPAFSERLDQICAVKVKEAADGDVLQPGSVYVAPGGRQMAVALQAGKRVIRIFDAAQPQNYKPSVDITFNALNEILPGKILAIVLTGMGSDGREGATNLKKSGSLIWSQDQETCVIYGMPMAIEKAGLSDAVLPLHQIGSKLMDVI